MSQNAAVASVPFSIQHDQIMGGLSKPNWLVEGNLTDNVWGIRVHSAKHVRSAVQRVRFDTAIAPGNYRTTDYECQHDLITAKLLCYHMLMPAPFGEGRVSVTGVKRRVELYFEYVRWRNRQGVPRNSLMSEAQLEGLLKDLRETGARAVRVDGLVIKYLEKLKVSGEPLPSYSFNTGRILHATAVADEMGLNSIRALPEKDWELLFSEAKAQGLHVKSRRMRCDKVWTGRRQRSGDDATVGVYAELIGIPKLLFRHRKRLAHDALRFRPFRETQTNTLARQLADKAINRTPTIPAFQACYLIERALHWVSEYATEIREFVEAVQADVGMDAPEGRRLVAVRRQTIAKGHRTDDNLDPTGPWPVRNGFRAAGKFADRPLLSRVATRLLPAACMIVIAAFSARRCEEMNSLRAGAVTVEDGELWLECWIGKTVRSLDQIPIPQSVANAVSILEWLSLARREAEGSEWLYNFNNPFTRHGATASIAVDVRAFAEHVKVPVLESGEAWWFSPHQFRRFFGITYFHHFRFPQLVVLSNFYRHFDPDMTRRYISEAASGAYLRQAEENSIRDVQLRNKQLRENRDRLRVFHQEGLNFRVERYRNIASGVERVSGFGGEWLRATFSKLKADAVSIVEIDPSADEDETFDHLLRNFAEVSRLEPNPLGHSYCKCTSDEVDLMAAACVNQAGESMSVKHLSSPNPRFAADLTCSACPHNVQFPENERYWREMAEHEERQQSCAFGTLLGELAGARLLAARDHCERCFD